MSKIVEKRVRRLVERRDNLLRKTRLMLTLIKKINRSLRYYERTYGKKGGQDVPA